MQWANQSCMGLPGVVIFAPAPKVTLRKSVQHYNMDADRCHVMRQLDIRLYQLWSLEEAVSILLRNAWLIPGDASDASEAGTEKAPGSKT